MSRVGVVSVNTSLNLRIFPGGPVIGSLPNGTRVTILETSNGWHRVEAVVPTLVSPRQDGMLSGFVSADFVAFDEVEVISGTPSAGFRFVGKEAVAPDGTAFARKFR